MNDLNQTMTPQKQRIAIAEACGWKISNLSVGRYCWSHPRLCAIGGPSVLAQGDPVGLPDYLNDLNAMHQVEKVIVPSSEYTLSSYMFELSKIVLPAGMTRRGLISEYIFHATAAQRAEAFLKTIGKWEGSQ
jgi:hypothetical protein